MRETHFWAFWGHHKGTIWGRFKLLCYHQGKPWWPHALWVSVHRSQYWPLPHSCWPSHSHGEMKYMKVTLGSLMSLVSLLLDILLLMLVLSEIEYRKGCCTNFTTSQLSLEGSCCCWNCSTQRKPYLEDVSW